MQLALYYGEWKYFFSPFLDFSLKSTISRFKNKFITLFRSMVEHRVYVNYAKTAFNRPIDIAQWRHFEGFFER